MRGFSSTWRQVLNAMVAAGVVAAAGCQGGGENIRPDAPVSGGGAEKLLIIDCLLPGQVRKLGASATYLTARRPAKLSASECEIRGGEYVAFDRADLRTSLHVWLPSAQAGDPQAQTYLGEIYEKGLGVPPDYRTAAAWYRKAADQGFSRAQTNLGYLYEKGLGVDKDPLEAMNWYRKASGLSDELVMASEVRQLETQLTASQQAAESARADAANMRRRLSRVESDLQTRKQQEQLAQTELNEVRTIILQQRTAPVQTAQAARRNESAERAAAEEDRKKIRQLQARLADQAKERSRLAQQAELLKARLAAAQQGSDALKSRVAETEAELDRQRAERARIASQQDALLRDQTRTAGAARSEINQLRRELDLARASLAEQRAARDETRSAETAALETRLSQSLAQIEMLESDLAHSKEKAGQAELEVTRLRIAQAIDEIQQTETAIEEKVTELPPEQQKQVKRVQVRLAPLRTRLDDQGKALDSRIAKANDNARQLAETDGRIQALEGEKLALRGRGEPATGNANEGISLKGVKGFGQYYALVIGNNEYVDFPRLQTAVNDARDVAAILRDKYSFKTTLLLNATYQQILSSLNELRKKLTADDNLVIYYAGHGELDTRNNRGHWIPVNAKADDSTHWISNVAITDILNVMEAKHVMVIADSCYSGQLARSAVASVKGGRSPAMQMGFYRKISQIRSRTVLSSGGLRPVLDSGGGDNSLFAKQLLAILHANARLLEGPELYVQVARRVHAAAQVLGVDQTPQYGPIKHAGDQLAPFIFLPKVS